MAKDPYGGLSRAEYQTRLIALQEDFKRLPYGSRMRAALEMGINPSVAYQVTNERAIDREILERFEAWVGTQLNPAKA